MTTTDMPTTDSSNVLARLRRYQQILVMGGGAAITAAVIGASLVEVVASVDAYMASTKEKVANDVRQSLRFTTQAVATVRNNVQNMESAWNSALADNGEGEPVPGPSGVLRVQATQDVPPLLVIRNDDAPNAGEAWRYVILASRMALATGAIAARNGGDLAVYLYSADQRYLILSVLPWGGSEWQKRITADRKSLFAALGSSQGKPISVAHTAAGVGGVPQLRWLPPYESPLTGQQAVRVATQLQAADGQPIGTLVYEMPLAALVSTLPSSGVSGTCMVVAGDGSEIVRCPDTTGRDMSEALRVAQASGLHGSSESKFSNGFELSSWPFGSTGWTLIHALSWREIAAGVRSQVILTLSTSTFVIALTWLLLLLVKRRVFVPAVRQSQRVFDSEQLSRTLVQTAPVGLGLIAQNGDGALLHSPTMEDVAKRVAHDGSDLSSTLLQHYQERGSQPARAGVRDLAPAVLRDELIFSTHDGQRLDLSVSMVRARYQDQDVLVTAFTDVTEKKRLEQELHDARLAAESANTAKSAFLAAMSHEIRTPLNAVLGNLELLAYSPLDDLQRDRLNIIRGASDGLLTVVSDVLDFSKIEAGELVLEDLQFDILELASETLMMFAPVARAKGLELAGDLGQAVAFPMQSDPARLRQVLNNLLSNAIKFTESGKVILRVSSDDARAQVVIEVEDTGIGMTTEQLSRLFLDFNQADATINRRFGGTGLGLALSQRLIHAMGGSLVPHSEAGAGSRFELRLPRGVSAHAIDAPRFDGEKLLLVAAAAEQREALARMLNAYGLQVTTYGHPALIAIEDVEDAGVLVFWGDRQTWHPDDENRVVEEAPWIVDCTEGGPAQPVASGRLVSATTYGMRALVNGLRYALQGHALAVRDQPSVTLDKRLRVLVAEDSPVNRRLFAEQLGLIGCDAVTVEDAEQALERLERETFDVLLTDLSMPGQDGFALARQTRERWPRMPVLAATANVTPQQREEGERAGMARVLGKPLSLTDLAQALAEVAGLRWTGSRTADDGLLGGRPMAEETWHTYRQSCLDAVQKMLEGARRDDAPILLAELHSVQGACRVFGFEQVAKRCAVLAQAISQHGVRACGDAVEALCDALLSTATREAPHLARQAERIVERLDSTPVDGSQESVAELAKTLLASLQDGQQPSETAGCTREVRP
ncbi:response regulator [Paraburkholderia sp. Ac-20342]|uniref:ATP-binding protein n=1 Tax=Paraburkholderia sp. Ac-20342 TaxID=2703889 RepID=UPI00197FB651|nr:response regulator [Paraburkholderia sp. Ac-20342]